MLRVVLGWIMVWLVAWPAAASLDLQLTGKMTQGGLIRGQVDPEALIFLNGQQLHISPEGYFVFGFGRDAELDNLLVVIPSRGIPEEINLHLTKRDYRIQRVTGIPRTIMRPSAKNLKHAAKDAKLIGKARKVFSQQTFFMDDFQWPAIGPITGVYGSQRFYNGEPSRPHFGVDVAKKTGSPVLAPAPGRVTLAEPNMFYSGGTLMLDHGYGVSSTFLHMSKLSVVVGDTVKAGQKIGEVGATGRASGPHLDWRINWFHVRIDPELVVPPMSKSR